MKDGRVDIAKMPFLVLGRYRPGRVQRRIAVCDREGLSVVARERELREFHTSRCRAIARGETAQPRYPGMSVRL